MQLTDSQLATLRKVADGDALDAGDRDARHLEAAGLIHWFGAYAGSHWRLSKAGEVVLDEHHGGREQ